MPGSSQPIATMRMKDVSARHGFSASKLHVGGPAGWSIFRNGQIVIRRLFESESRSTGTRCAGICHSCHRLCRRISDVTTFKGIVLAVTEKIGVTMHRHYSVECYITSKNAGNNVETIR